MNSRIYNLKKWLTLEDAAAYVSRSLGEACSVADLLQLSLDGHVVISVNFVNHAKANLGAMVKAPLAKMRLYASTSKSEHSSEIQALAGDLEAKIDPAERAVWFRDNLERVNQIGGIFAYVGDQVDRDRILEWQSGLETIDGIWDIPNFGGARLDVEHALQALIDGPEVTLSCLGGTVVVDETGTRFARLMEPFEHPPKGDTDEGAANLFRRSARDYFPCGGLPDDAVMVVRPLALDKFIADSNATVASVQKDVGTREKAGLLKLIAGLADLAKIDLRSDKAAVQLEAAAAPYDGPGAKTLRKHIETIREEILPHG